MKTNRLISLFIICYVFTMFLSCKERFVTFTPGKLWLDDNGIHINAHGGGVLFHNGIYYWYGEHKIHGVKGNRAYVGIHCYSSKNLKDWKDEGIVLPVEEEDNCEITKGSILERPKVIYNRKNNNFVMWFHLEIKNQGYDAARSGVAVSDSPTGPFTFIKSLRPNAGYWPVNLLSNHKRPVPDSLIDSKFCGGPGCLPLHPDSLNLLGRDFKGGQMARDMTLFVDDDERAYHIYSSEENSTLHISLLNDDYMSHSGVYYRFFVNRYMEAPALFKHNGKYYLIASGCTGWDPNAARLAQAPSIFGPWKELGNPCKGKNSEITFKGQSTYVLPVAGKKDAFIFMADLWKPDNAIDGRYIWLPIKWEADKPVVKWYNKWSMEIFDNE